MVKVNILIIINKQKSNIHLQNMCNIFFLLGNIAQEIVFYGIVLVSEERVVC